MPKTLVAYYSLTGNTKKIAEAIHEEITGDRSLRPIDQVADIESFGLVFVGFPVHAHSVPIKVEAFLKKIPAGAKIALFSTHGSLSGMSLSREAVEYATVLVAKAKLLGTFTCRGKVSPQAMEVLSKSPEHEAWTDMAASAATHPDAHDVADARAFAKWITTLSAHGGF